MGKRLDDKKALCKEIETVRELLHKKIEENTGGEEIQQVSETLDKLIVAYFTKVK
ncbi:Spo0E family sporulation regulatory protein-aspartic acid phosphatase [Clostridium sp. WILCCON 0269]|uniref:Spo0E family sporulation regulatory protein-aspartic acid phosphatase n=1 Tax=Candidatus Clostridium eludens TaxID=3381663 RepID=A0ABW8SME5_9CLOT